MADALARVTNPRLQGSPRQKAHSPFEGQRAFIVSDVRGEESPALLPMPSRKREREEVDVAPEVDEA